MDIFNYDNRSLRILNILESNYITSEKYLISNLRVSSKTISNEIKFLNKEFENIAYIENKNTNYILYIIKLEKYLNKKQKLYDLSENFDSSKVRLVYIFKKVISEKHSHLIDDLAFEMIVSRTTLNTDLKKLNDIISSYQLEIKGKPNKGITIFGSEKNIRIFILENMYNYMYKEDIFDLEDNKFFSQLFEKYKIDEQIKNEFLRYLTISIDRYANEFLLNFEVTEYNELFEYYVKDFINEISDYILIKYNINLSSDEKKFITICFATMRVPSEINKIKNNIQYTNEYKQLVQEILIKVADAYGLNLDISDIIEEFIYHIYFLMERLKYGVRYRNTMKEQIKEKYPMSYKMAKTAGEVINSKYSYTVSEDEIGYLTIYFETFLEKINQSNKKFNILLITDAGPAFKKLMIKELESNIVKNNMTLTTINSYENIDYNIFDVIISTVEKNFATDLQVIKQNEILDILYLAKEINFLKYIGKMHTPSIRGMESILLSSISTHTFYLCDKNKTYEENLTSMIGDLQKKNIVDNEFLYKIKEREKKSSMLFSENVAFPHTVNETDDNFTIALGISEEGFKDNRELKLIFLACVPKDKASEMVLTKTYDELISIIKDKKIITSLSKIKTYDELINYFVKSTNLYR